MVKNTCSRFDYACKLASLNGEDKNIPKNLDTKKYILHTKKINSISPPPLLKKGNFLILFFLTSPECRGQGSSGSMMKFSCYK